MEKNEKNSEFLEWANFTQTIVYDDEGNVRSNSLRKGSSNGKGWVMMYTDKVQELIVKCPSAATLKVFMLLSMGQQFDDHGMITTKKAVQEKLGITKPTCLDAFKWLKENFIVNEYKTEQGYTEFMVNPAFVTVGRDKRKREKEWRRRWMGQTVLTLPADRPPIGGIVEPKEKTAPVKKSRRVVAFD